ncbi:DUF2937 family protein [Aliiglaciecola lipolytica]|uniref:DUF2937 domain-containing protein n=1 Tax=Aliiglaciecola lipolytica E3 TaxID=1127673 RepID=K6YA48_9ALTE|nr:DUF2937 family protein [Aliiglaciecola lipolytica]GAC15067.1 hypothetical protein GLIP_2441 [Aliiglaciecola lipolytica E3]
MIKWLLRQFADYLRLFLFAGGVLIGVQAPGFMQQYQQRVEAHMLEAKQNLAGFQFTADRYFDGSIEKLIAYYRASDDPVFKQDANSITAIYQRVELLEGEFAAMSQHPVKQAWHLINDADEQLRLEAFHGFNFTVPLNPLALLWGLGIAILLLLTIDTTVFTCRKCAEKLRGHQHHHS